MMIISIVMTTNDVGGTKRKNKKRKDLVVLSLIFCLGAYQVISLS